MKAWQSYKVLSSGIVLQQQIKQQGTIVLENYMKDVLEKKVLIAQFKQRVTKAGNAGNPNFA